MLIYVEEIKNGGRYRAELEDGTVIVKSSRQPLLDSARVLQRQGVAADTELVMARRGGETSLRGKLGELAKLRVEEGDRSAPHFRSWKPDERF